MKDARFTELLNLYLDHRLSADEAAELEAEVMRNPARRRVYDNYCRMQRACNLLFESECENAPRSLALARSLNEVERKLAAPADARVRRPVVWLGWSGAAAAACVVVVSVAVVLRSRSPGLTAAPTVAAVASPAMGGAALEATPVISVVSPDGIVSDIVVATAAPAAQPAASAPDALVQQWSRQAAQRWIDTEAEALVNSRLVDDGRFEMRRVGATDEFPSFQTTARTEAGSWRGELTAYQFQR